VAELKAIHTPKSRSHEITSYGAILRHQAVLLLPTIPQLWVASCVWAGFRNNLCDKLPNFQRQNL